MRKYVKPILTSEMFTANEFVSACGDGGVTYKFKCDAGYIGDPKEHTKGLCGCGSIHSSLFGGIPEGTYREKGSWTIYNNDGTYIGSPYSPCGSTHEADSNGVFLEGYIVENNTGEKRDVVVWRGESGTNGHCTSNLDMDSWEIARS